MGELFTSALAGDANALAGVAALVSIVALVPAALIFIVNQFLQNVQLREEKYRYLQDQYRDFLTIGLDHPELGLEHGTSKGFSELDAPSRIRLFIAFEIFTALLEVAFKLYERSFTSNRRTQWEGWRNYLKRYLARDDYQLFLSEILFSDDIRLAVLEGRESMLVGRSEYDTAFEKFLLMEAKSFFQSADGQHRAICFD